MWQWNSRPEGQQAPSPGHVSYSSTMAKAICLLKSSTTTLACASLTQEAKPFLWALAALPLPQKHKKSREPSYRLLLLKHEFFIEEMELFETELIFLGADFL